MRHFAFCAGLSLAAIACASDRATGVAQVPANADGALSAAGVSIIGTITGRSAAGDTVALRFVNSGPETAYIPRCGADPLVLTQQFVNGTWIGGVQNFMCITPSAPGPVRLDPGASVTVIRIVQAGRYRMTASVATKADLSNAMPVVSNAVDAP
jgi:hypothetical protein